MSKHKNKYDTNELMQICGERLETSKAFSVVGKGKPRPEVSTLEEFARRGFKYGTPQQSWKALEAMAAGLATDEGIPPEVALWFVNAMNSVERGDIKGLVRQLGFHEMGRSRVVNPHDIGNRMTELVEKRGMSKAEASRQCATEFKCSPSTALAWYAKR